MAGGPTKIIITFTFQSGYIQIIRKAVAESRARNFTFQSGYIQIRMVMICEELRLPLHSNLVIFKYLDVEKYEIVATSLHSNLVIFKCETFANKIYKCHLYIPIWLYSNDILKSVSHCIH